MKRFRKIGECGEEQKEDETIETTTF